MRRMRRKLSGCSRGSEERRRVARRVARDSVAAKDREMALETTTGRRGWIVEAMLARLILIQTQVMVHESLSASWVA